MPAMAPGQTAGRLLAAAAVVVAAFAASPAAAWGTGEWMDGRGTFFGEDAWSLHEGSCGYGFICPNRWSDELVSGRDTVALADVDPMWANGAACGQCLEVRCRDATVKDGNGVSFDRAGSQYCKEGHPSVKVKVTDRCDCNYAENYASNKRWCCGDMKHLDVSQWALEKIAKDPETWGVFAVEYRTVDCGAKIENEAPAVPLSQQDADPHDAAYRKGTDCNAQATGSKGSSGTPGLTTESQSQQRAPSPNKRKGTYTWRDRLADVRAARAAGKPGKAVKYGKKAWQQRLAQARAARAAGKPVPNIKYKGRRLLQTLLGVF